MGATIAEPGPLAVPLAELKAFLRIGNSEEDALLAGLVRSAADTCEAFTGRMLIVRDGEETIRASTAWTRLATAPVRAIVEVAALDAESMARLLDPADHAIDIDAAGEGWVRLTGPIAETRVKVRYRAGLARDESDVPEAVRHGIVRLAAHFYTHRDAVDGGGAPAAVTALWRPWRRLRLR